VADENDGPFHRSLKHPISDQLRDQSMRMLQDAIGRCSSKQRRNRGVVAVGENPRVAHIFREHFCIGEPEFLGLFRRPCFGGMAIQAMHGDDTVVIFSSVVDRVRAVESSYSTTGLLPLKTSCIPNWAAISV
jgi:hypothetical protein